MDKPENLLSYAAERVGFPVKEGMYIRVMIETMGADHDDQEHTLPAGSLAKIDRIEWFTNDQKLAITVVIPVDPVEFDERMIVNLFDEADPEDSRFPFQKVGEPFEFVRLAKVGDVPGTLEGWYIIAVDAEGEEWDALGAYDTAEDAKRIMKNCLWGER
jgi:hypothetical protein